MLGLMRGEVELLAHDPQWKEDARRTIAQLQAILGGAAVDIQHVGSTAIASIRAKPILDIAVGMRRMDDLDAFLPALAAAGLADRGEDHPGQRLLVAGALENGIVTHHIHVAEWNGEAWKNYLRMRDFLARSSRARQGLRGA